MKLEIDMPEHHYNNIIAFDPVSLGRVPYKGIIMYAINAIKRGKALEQEPQTFKWCTDCKEYDQEKHCCHRWSKVIRDTVEEMKQEQEPMVEIDLYSVIKPKYIEREVLDKIRAEIIKYESDCRLSVDEYPLCEQCTDNVFETIYGILDKYKAKSEVEK